MIDFSFILNNPVLHNPFVSGAIASIMGAMGLGAYLAKAWRESKYKGAIETGEEAFGNLAGLRAAKVIDATVKDPSINREIKTNLDKAPEQFDKGFDRGLRGLKIGTPEYDQYKELQND